MGNRVVDEKHLTSVSIANFGGMCFIYALCMLCNAHLLLAQEQWHAQKI